MTAPRPTLDTVAEAAGVSRMTVSNAYNRPDQLSAATRERVLAVAAELGYGGPDPAGRSLRRGRAGTVGVLLTENLTYAFTDPGLVQFLRGVADEMSAARMAMLLLPSDTDRDGALVRSAIVDAFIVCSVREDDPVVAAVRARRLPFVSAGSPRLTGAPFVGIDNLRSGALAADHLLGLGHRRLGIVALPEDMPVEPHDQVVRVRRGFAQRVAGFLERAAEGGVGPEEVVVVDAETNSTDAGIAAGRAMLDRDQPPTAIFAVSDVLALGALAAAADLGIEVPGAVSVIGFDDIDEASHARPPLTTVAQDLREQGRIAARLTLGLIDGKKVRSTPRSAHVLVRESTSVPRRTIRPGDHAGPAARDS